jgi:hypothetical protein
MSTWSKAIGSRMSVTGTWTGLPRGRVYRRPHQPGQRNVCIVPTSPGPRTLRHAARQREKLAHPGTTQAARARRSGGVELGGAGLLGLAGVLPALVPGGRLWPGRIFRGLGLSEDSGYGFVVEVSQVFLSV